MSLLKNGFSWVLRVLYMNLLEPGIAYFSGPQIYFRYAKYVVIMFPVRLIVPLWRFSRHCIQEQGMS